MKAIFSSIFQAFKALFDLRVLLLLTLPTVIAFVISVIIFKMVSPSLVEFAVSKISTTWIYDYIQKYSSFDYKWLITTICYVFMILILFPFYFVSSLLLASFVSLPALRGHLTNKYFPHLLAEKGGSVIFNYFNLLSSLCIYVVGVLVTLPLWVVPGMQILIPMVLGAWLYRRVYGYETLYVIANKVEREKILKEYKQIHFGIGFIGSLLNYVPLANFIAPLFTGMVFTFFNLKKCEEIRLNTDSIQQG